MIEITIPDSASSKGGDSPSSNEKSKKVQVVRENIGIVVAYQLNELVDAIRNNPKGPKHAP